MILLGHMKKLIFLMFFGSAFMSSVTLAQASNASLTISVPDSARKNDVVAVSVSGSNFTASDDVTALSFWMNYDHRVMQYTGYVSSSIAGNNLTLGTAVADTVGLTWDGGAGSKLILNNQNFVTLNFKVISDKKATVDFRASNISAANNLGDPVFFEIHSATLQINKNSVQEIEPQPIVIDPPVVSTPSASVILSNPVVAPPVSNNYALQFTPTYTPFYTPTNLNNTVSSKLIPTYPPRDFAPKVAPIIYEPKAISLVNSAFSVGTFEKDLQLGSNDPDVIRLQKYLNFNKYTIAQSGPGSVGNESTYFGESTYQALKKFQSANGIPSTGYFGPVTRKLFSK